MRYNAVIAQADAAYHQECDAAWAEYRARVSRAQMRYDSSHRTAGVQYGTAVAEIDHAS